MHQRGGAPGVRPVAAGKACRVAPGPAPGPPGRSRRSPSVILPAPGRTDSMSDPLSALLLGILEGLTEFLPVSSTGHLLIAQHWLGARSDFFNIVIQAGAILAITLVFRQRIWQLATGLGTHDNRDYAMKLAAAFLVTALVGLPVRLAGWELPETVTPVAWALILGGLWMLLAEHFAERRGDSTHVTWTVAVLVGLAQVVAGVFPAPRVRRGDLHGMLAGLEPALGGPQFVFLVGIPTMFAASGTPSWKCGRRADWAATLGRRGWPSPRPPSRVRGGEVAAGLHQAPPLHRLRRVPDPARRRARAVAAGGRLTERFPGRARSAPRLPSRAACGCRSTPPASSWLQVARPAARGPTGATAAIHRQAGASGEGTPDVRGQQRQLVRALRARHGPRAPSAKPCSVTLRRSSRPATTAWRCGSSRAGRTATAPTARCAGCPASSQPRHGGVLRHRALQRRRRGSGRGGRADHAAADVDRSFGSSPWCSTPRAT